MIARSMSVGRAAFPRSWPAAGPTAHVLGSSPPRTRRAQAGSHSGQVLTRVRIVYGYRPIIEPSPILRLGLERDIVVVWSTMVPRPVQAGPDDMLAKIALCHRSRSSHHEHGAVRRAPQRR